MIKVLIPNLKQTIYKVSLEPLLYKKGRRYPNANMDIYKDHRNYFEGTNQIGDNSIIKKE